MNEFINHENMKDDEAVDEIKDHCEFNYINNFVDTLVSDKNKESIQFKYEFKILPYSNPIDGDEKFKCPMCHIDDIKGRKELTEHLHNHQVQYKAAEGRHLCCLCSKELSSNSSLERHLLTHSNHRPYDCVICGKKFTTNGNLSRHIKASHSNNNAHEKLNEFSMIKDDPKMITTATNDININPTKLLDLQPKLPLNLSTFPLPSTQPEPQKTNTIPQNTLTNQKSLFLRLLENTLSNFPYLVSPYNCIKPENEVLNLSVKNEPINPFLFTTNFPTFYPYLLPVNDAPLDLSIKRNPDIKHENAMNSFLSNYPSNEADKLINESTDVTDDNLSSQSSTTNKENNKLLETIIKNEIGQHHHQHISTTNKIKKNSYKDAPKLIRCPIIGCSQKFPWNSSLMRHILTHTAHKPFKCIRCPKCFSTKSNRERHMHRVHGIQANGNNCRRHNNLNEQASPTDVSPITTSESLPELTGKSSPINSFNDTQSISLTNTPNHHNTTIYLSEEEWLQMNNNDRQAEDISHSLLKQAGEPVIEPNPLRKPTNINTYF